MPAAPRRRASRARRPESQRVSSDHDADGDADSLGIALSTGANVSAAGEVAVPAGEQAMSAAAMATNTMSRLSIWSPPGIDGAADLGPAPGGHLLWAISDRTWPDASVVRAWLRRVLQGARSRAVRAGPTWRARAGCDAHAMSRPIPSHPVASSLPARCAHSGTPR
jgi:hypothetical protein